MEPQEELAQRIRRYVITQVAPGQVDVVTRSVVVVVATLMQDQRFFNELEQVKELLNRLTWLHNENLILKQTLASVTTTGPRKKATAKKAAPRKRAAPRVRGGTAAQRDAFRQGFSS